jgi:hypothetical protein
MPQMFPAISQIQRALTNACLDTAPWFTDPGNPLINTSSRWISQQNRIAEGIGIAMVAIRKSIITLTSLPAECSKRKVLAEYSPGSTFGAVNFCGAHRYFS